MARKRGSGPGLDELEQQLQSIQQQIEARKAAENTEAQLTAPKFEKRFTKVDEETLLKVAKQSLEQFGTVLPPLDAYYIVMDATLPQLRPRRQRRARLPLQAQVYRRQDRAAESVQGLSEGFDDATTPSINPKRD